MNENEFRNLMSKEELELRSYIITFKVYDFETLERLNKYSSEFNKTWDELINTALNKFMDDIEDVHSLRF